MKQEVKPEMLRVPKVARLLDVSHKRIYQLIQEGRLEAIRLGPRQIRVLRESLDGYIEALRRQERIARGEEEPEEGWEEAPKRSESRLIVRRSARPAEFNAKAALSDFFGEKERS